eukprot:6835909-Ditylum_brightwellii.AAC.1
MLHLSQDPTTPLCACNRINNKWTIVRDKDITEAVHFAVAGCSLLDKVYTLSKVESHFFRARGAMALKINSVDDATIKKIG